jgi:DNA-binding LytR/AlgR family response regulator
MESLKDYVKVYTSNGAITTKYKISDMEDELSGKSFLRIHRSFIINLKHITAFTASDVEIGKTELPIGESYKEHVTRALRTLR